MRADGLGDRTLGLRAAPASPAASPAGSGSAVSAGGAGVVARGTGTPGHWSAVQDELRTHQSLTSVINDPRGKGLFRTQWEGVHDLWEAVGEIVEELGEARELEAQESVDAAVFARTEELIGKVPELPDFQPYLETFAELWEVYHRNHRSKPRRPAEAGAGHGIGHGAQQRNAGISDDSTACEAHRAVPHEYFMSDFKLEHHPIFKQSLQTSVERQEELNVELTGYLDLIELSLFEQIRRAQRDQLFDSLARLNEPLQEDLRATLSVLATLRGQLRSVQRRQLRNGLAVGRLARRKRRAAEVLQRLDTLAHVQQSQPSIQMLLQGQDYVTALDLLESTSAAVESNLKGLASARPCSARLSRLTRTFDCNVEAYFVHHSTEAIFGVDGNPNFNGNSTASSSTAGAPAADADGELELRGSERLRRLCYCLVRRELLRTSLSGSLRDVLLARLKKVLKSRARTLLEELVAAQGTAVPGCGEEPEESAAETAAGAAPQAPAVGSGEEDTAAATADGQPSPAAGPSRAAANEATSGITAALVAVGFEGFLTFWRQILQDCIDVAARLCEFAVLVQGAASEVQQEATPSQAGHEAELMRLFEVIMNSYLSKVGVLLQAKEGENRFLKAGDWKRLLKLTNESLDKVRGFSDQCRQRLCLKEHVGVGDATGGISGILYAQTKHIVEEFDKRCTERMECALEQERWERTEVPSQYRVILERLVGKERGPELDAADQAVERYLHVDGVHFLVVPAVLTLVQLLNDYVDLCREFESMPEVVIQRMCNLLKVFNSRTHQLVLGGQSVQKQTMKKITASNLALCSQCCGLVAQILPSLQAHLQSLFPVEPGLAAGSTIPVATRAAVASLVGNLTSIAEVYNAHRSALFGKLSDLLHERYQFHAKKWFSSPHLEIKDDADAVLWSKEANGAEAAMQASLHPHEALEGFVKDITNMYRVLLKSLTGDSVRKIFAKAFEEIAAKFEQRLGQDLAAPAPSYEDRVGRSLGDRLALDIAFLQEQLEKLSGISTPLQRLLVDLVCHLRARMPTDDPVKALHPSVLETLQRLGRLPR